MLGHHRHRRLIAVHALAREHVRADELVERAQKRGAAAHLVGQRRHAQIDAFAGVAFGLPIERLVLPILLEQDHGEQARSAEAARQHVERRRRLANLLAVPAGELLAHGLHHLPLPWHHLERLSDILAKLGEPARTAAAAAGRAGHDHALAQQMRRERLAGGLPAGEGANRRGRCGLRGGNLIFARRRLKLLELQLHLVEQTLLALVARAKQVALELLDLQPQTRDQRLRARCLGAHVRHLGLRARRLGPRLRKLRIACLQQPLQRLDIIGERIIRAHAQDGITRRGACESAIAQ